MRLRTPLAVLSVIALMFGAVTPASADIPGVFTCTDDLSSAPAIPAPLPSGHYALPSEPPTTLVVYAHGYGHSGTTWQDNLSWTASKGLAAVATDYAGTVGNRGWRVREGAQEAVQMAQVALAVCPSITNVVLFGVSMGGNSSGLALAAKAKRADGSPLFDYWFDVEGAVNVTETYLEATAVAGSGNAYAVNAKTDIEQAFGGTIAEKPDIYLDSTVVARADDVAASGVKGIVFVHSLDDGLVPYNQSREMAASMDARGVPFDFYTVARRGDGQAGTTLTSYGLAKVYTASGLGESPLAGHASEVDRNHAVMETAFGRMFELLGIGSAPRGISGHHEFLVDNDVITPVL